MDLGETYPQNIQHALELNPFFEKLQYSFSAGTTSQSPEGVDFLVWRLTSADAPPLSPQGVINILRSIRLFASESNTNLEHVMKKDILYIYLLRHLTRNDDQLKEIKDLKRQCYALHFLMTTQPKQAIVLHKLIIPTLVHDLTIGSNDLRKISNFVQGLDGLLFMLKGSKGETIELIIGGGVLTIISKSLYVAEVESQVLKWDRDNTGNPNRPKLVWAHSDVIGKMAELLQFIVQAFVLSKKERCPELKFLMPFVGNIMKGEPSGSNLYSHAEYVTRNVERGKIQLE